MARYLPSDLTSNSAPVAALKDSRFLKSFGEYGSKTSEKKKFAAFMKCSSHCGISLFAIIIFV